MTTMEVLTSAEINQIAGEIATEGCGFKVDVFPLKRFYTLVTRYDECVKLTLSPVYQFMNREQMRETLAWYYERVGTRSIDEGRKNADVINDTPEFPSVLDEFRNDVRKNELAFSYWLSSIDCYKSNVCSSWLRDIARELNRPEINDIIVALPKHDGGWSHAIKDMHVVVVAWNNLNLSHFEEFRKLVLEAC